MNPRLLITFTVTLLSQSVFLAVRSLVTDDADTVEAGKLQRNCDFQFVRTSSTSLYLVPINPVLGLTPRLELGAIFGYQRRDGLHSSFCYAFSSFNHPRLFSAGFSRAQDVTHSPRIPKLTSESQIPPIAAPRAAQCGSREIP